jgi:Tol biopolymer transport system component
LARRLAFGALLLVGLTACGSSFELPANGRIAAARNGVLYVMNRDGAGLRKVPHWAAGPAVWTPDGKWLAFNTGDPITDASGSYTRLDLWLMRPDGTGRRLVARNVPLGAVSPDGKTVAFMNDSCQPDFTAECELGVDNATEIYTIGIDGRGPRRLTHNRWYDGDPSWSPDGERIVFATDFGPRIMDRDGTHVRLVTKGDWSSAPLWSPRGDEILISTPRGWGLVSPAGGEIEYLDPGPRGPEWGATWSPDGMRIAYLFRRAREWTAHDPMQIWVMNADGTGRHPITKTFGWAVPSWAPAS